MYALCCCLVYANFVVVALDAVPCRVPCLRGMPVSDIHLQTYLVCMNAEMETK